MDEDMKFTKWMESHFICEHKHKIIYCPIEKNACTFFKRLLLEQGECAQEYANDGLDVHTFINLKRKLILHNRALFADPSYLSFVVVREPIHRIVSAYLNKFVRNREFYWAIDASEKYCQRHPEHKVEESLTFAEFVDVLLHHPDAELDGHWRPQSTFFEPVAAQFDWLVPMERIAPFISVLEERMGVEISRDKTRNQNQYQSYSHEEQMEHWKPARLREADLYPDDATLAHGELLEKLKKRFQRDTDLYQMAVERFAESHAAI